MNKRSTIIAGLDIGTSKICCVVARKNPVGKVEILGVGMAESTGVLRGVISNIDKTVQAINKAVGEASRRSGIKIKNIYVGITGLNINCHRRKGYILRHSLDNEISQRDVDRLIADMHTMSLSPGEEIIHILPQEFSVDNLPKVSDPIGMSGLRLDGDFYIVTGEANTIKTIKRCLEKANLSVAGICLEPIASASSVLCEEEKEAGVALIDIGGGTTDLAIYKDGVVRHIAIVPFGGSIVTRDIKEGCNVMTEQAEKLKVKFGTALASEAKENAIVSISGYLRGREAKEISLRNLSYIIQARMEEIIEYCYYEIKESGFENKLIGGIVLTGGGAKLDYLQYLTQYLTGLDVRIGLPIDQLANGKREMGDPIFSTAIGLVTRTLEENEMPVPAKEIVEVVQKPTIKAALESKTMPTTMPTTMPKVALYEPTMPVNEATHEEILETEAEEVLEDDNGGWFNTTIQKWRNWLEKDVKDFD